MATTPKKPFLPAWQAILVILALVPWVACQHADTPNSPEQTEQKTEPDDLTPPFVIEDLALSYPSLGGDALLSWTAPRDEGGSTSDVATYVIRYSYSSPLVWDQAVSVADPPAPQPAGDPQDYRFAEPRRGRDLYAAVRSFDNNGNGSAVSNVAHVYIPGMVMEGTCLDVMSGERLEGLQVQVSDRRLHTAVTDAGGRYRFEELAAGFALVKVTSGTSETPFHNYSSELDLRSDLVLEHLMVPFIPTEVQTGGNVLALLTLALGINNYRPNLVKWKSFPVDVYVPAFVNASQVDYEDTCRRAVEHWNDRVGMPLFRLVDAQPEVGVWFRFRPPEDMAPLVGITHHENDAEGYPKTSDISIANDFSTVDSVWEIALHELGHTVRFGHLPVGYLMYGGRPLPPTVTTDEVLMTRLYLAIPNGTDLTSYYSGDPE